MITECHLLALNKELKLENIKELLSENYSFVPPSLKEVSGLSDEEKNLYNSWNEIEDILNLNEKVRYFKAKGKIEVSIGSFYSKGTGLLKKKSDRVNTSNVEVVFLEIMVDSDQTLTFAVISGSENILKNIKSHLLGGSRSLDKTLKDKWGKTETSKYITFDPNFFLWLLIKNENNELDKIELLDIHHIDNRSETKDRHHTDQGIGVLNDALAKASLSRASNLLKLGVVLDCEYGQFNFDFDSNGNIEFNEKSCLYNEEGNPVSLIDENKIELIIYIYGYIFPTLLSLYREDINTLTWKSENIPPFRKKQGLKALIEMANNLELFDLTKEEEEDIVRKLMDGEVEVVIKEKTKVELP